MKDCKNKNKCPVCGFYSIEESIAKSNLLITIYEKKCTNCYTVLKKNKKTKIKILYPVLIISFTCILLFLTITKKDKKEINKKITTKSTKKIQILTHQQRKLEKRKDIVKHQKKLKEQVISKTKKDIKKIKEEELKEENITELPLITMNNRHRFGVNWSKIKEGLVITKISQGPLENAGLKRGDIIIKANNLPANNKILMKLRDEVVDGKKKYAVIEVQSKKDIKKFKLINTPTTQ